MSFYEECFNRFNQLEKPVLPFKQTNISKNSNEEEESTGVHPSPIPVLSKLDEVILSLKSERHPNTPIPRPGLFAVLVQDALGGKPCLADIENRIRQWQHANWNPSRVEAMR